jgi:hypothetical protein
MNGNIGKKQASDTQLNKQQEIWELEILAPAARAANPAL